MTKFATYRGADAGPRVGIVYGHDASLFDLAAAAERAGTSRHPFASMIDLMDAGPRGLDLSRRLFDDHAGSQDLSVGLQDVELLAPVPEPRQMRDGMSFPTHIRQSPRGMRKLAVRGDAAALAAIEAEPLAPLAEVYSKLPIYYITNRMVVRGPEQHGALAALQRGHGLRARVRGLRRPDRCQSVGRGGARRHLRLHDLQRLLGPRPADEGNAGLARARQGQELRRRQRDRPLDRDTGRDRRPLRPAPWRRGSTAKSGRAARRTACCSASRR